MTYSEINKNIIIILNFMDGFREGIRNVLCGEVGQELIAEGKATKEELLEMEDEIFNKESALVKKLLQEKTVDEVVEILLR